MKTKYVRAHSGIFALFSELLGLQHSQMADHVADARSMSDAGFAYIDMSGKLGVYGRSITLGIAANEIAAADMNAALAKSELRLYPFLDRGVIATNAHLLGDYEIATSIEQLRERRVFWSDD